MNELLIYIIIFLVFYIIDLATALLHRYMRPNNFKLAEANDRFRKCIDNRGVLKGIGAYIILGATETIILFIAVGIAANIIFSSTITEGLMFTFLLLAMVHILGAFTNLIGLLKKDFVPKQPMINVNNMNNLNKNNNSISNGIRQCPNMFKNIERQNEQNKVRTII